MQQPRVACHIGEGTVAVVSIQHIPAPVCDEHVLMAVVVVVADAHAAGPAGASQARFVRYVSEGAITVVVIKPVGGFRRIAVQGGSAQDEEVHPPITVVVDKRSAATRGLQNSTLLIHPAIDRLRGQPGLRGDIREMGMKREARRLSPRQRFHRAGRNALRPRRYPRQRQQFEPVPPLQHGSVPRSASWPSGNRAVSVIINVILFLRASSCSRLSGTLPV